MAGGFCYFLMERLALGWCGSVGRWVAGSAKSESYTSEGFSCLGRKCFLLPIRMPDLAGIRKGWCLSIQMFYDESIPLADCEGSS